MNIADLPPSMTTKQAAELLGISTRTLYELARTGRAPVEPLHLGRSLRWPRDPLLELLGLVPSRAALLGSALGKQIREEVLKLRPPKPEESDER